MDTHNNDGTEFVEQRLQERAPRKLTGPIDRVIHAGRTPGPNDLNKIWNVKDATHSVDREQHNGTIDVYIQWFLFQRTHET